ncbi:MAG: helix-turn-helix domain-containing protein [Haloglomus sp.]
MKCLHLTIHLDDEALHPVHRAICEGAPVERELLFQANPEGDLAALLFYIEGDHEAYESLLVAAEQVAAFDLVTTARGCYAYVREEPRPEDEVFYEAFDVGSLVLVPPVEFRPDRTMRLTVLGEPDRLETAVDALEAGEGVRVDVDGVSSRPAPARAGRLGGGDLTERQREALAAAWRTGYYKVPRDGSVADVADALDVAESTASTHLRKAEARLVGRVMGE